MTFWKAIPLQTNHSAAVPSLERDALTPIWRKQPQPMPIDPAVETSARGLKVLQSFLQDLRQQAVEYCHWKSNMRLDQSLYGETDLDLLVNRYHSQRFRQILHEHNIKPVLAAPGKRYPAVEDYLGFDPESGRSFHLHVHYQLVLGEQFVKNYRLPLETHFFESVRWQQGVAIPSPELEIIVLSLRALLKYRDRDVIKDILTIRYPGIPDHITEEIHYLLAQTSMEKIAHTLREIPHIVPETIVLEFLRTITTEPRAGYKLYRLRQSVRRLLNRYQRQVRVRTFLIYFRELWQRSAKLRRFSPSQQMTPVNGGMTLALVGADGAGKSTMSKHLRKWLGWKLDVCSFYLGSKQPSIRSRTLYIVFRMFRRSHSELTRWLNGRHALARSLARVRDNLLCIYHLSIGHDRHARYVQGMRKAMAGSIVIFDRFPLESISSEEDFRLLDGPQISLESESEPGAFAQRLGTAEQALYADMRPPDFLFVLDVSPEVSLQRKPDHQINTVTAKAQAVAALVEMEDLASRGIHVFHLNADLPLETVLHQLRTQIWELL